MLSCRDIPKRYALIGESIQESIGEYIQDVSSREFPKTEHSFSMDAEIVAQIASETP